MANKLNLKLKDTAATAYTRGDIYRLTGQGKQELVSKDVIVSRVEPYSLSELNGGVFTYDFSILSFDNAKSCTLAVESDGSDTQEEKLDISKHSTGRVYTFKI